MHDVFGNSITLLEFATRRPSCGSRAGSRSRRSGSTSRTIAWRPTPTRWPFAYDAEDRRDLGPTLDRHYPDEGGGSARLGAGDPGRRELGTLELLTRLTREIKQRLRYAARDDEGTQAPLETLAKGGGTCRDYALLMMEAVRSLGFAARFVTGYLYDPALDGGPSGTQGAGATHAWVQVYLPGAGWVEFDPTNGIVGGKNLIRVGVARDPRQAIPLIGSFRRAPERLLGLEVQVQVTRIHPGAISV